MNNAAQGECEMSIEMEKVFCDEIASLERQAAAWRAVAEATNDRRAYRHSAHDETPPLAKAAHIEGRIKDLRLREARTQFLRAAKAVVCEARSLGARPRVTELEAAVERFEQLGGWAPHS
jgi:hypothetical protein